MCNLCPFLESPRVKKSTMSEELMVSLGKELELSCSVEGTPQPVVTWTHNGHVVTNKSHSVQGHTHTLHMGSVKQASAGKYTCVASNTAGVAEDTFKVKVLGKSIKLISGQY